MVAKLDKPARQVKSKLVSRSAIQAVVDAIVQRFQPVTVTLFGSYATGTAKSDSDVDLFVVMPTRNELDQMGKIRDHIECDFPLDVIMRTPDNLRKRLEWGDWFLKGIQEHGIVLYEQNHERVGAKSRSRHLRRRTVGGAKAAAQ